MIKGLSKKQQAQLDALLHMQPMLMRGIKALQQAGGRVLLVGGAVRDLLLGNQLHDLDFEVYGLKFDQIEHVLKKTAPASLVGKSFGVVKIHGVNADFSMPRTDSVGRKPKVMLDPHMSFHDAFARRDLTINAMGIDLVAKTLIDPFGGQRDLKELRLRAPDAQRFVHDPLRFYRVMQFVGRFGSQPDEELNALCARMDLMGVARERVEQEFVKLFLLSKKPSLGIEWLRLIGRLPELVPELAATIGVMQDKRWHPEGDVYEHTLQTLDAVAGMHFASDKEKVIVCWAALGHDLGKVAMTQIKEDGRISSHGHEIASVPLAKKMMRRITRDVEIISGACALIRYHMLPGQFMAYHARPSAFKRLAIRLAPYATLELLGNFACADKRARNAKKGAPLKTGDRLERQFLAQAKKLNVLASIEKPVLQGRDLVDVIKPGPHMGILLKKAYALQLDKGITDKGVLKKRACAWAKRLL